MVPSNLLHFQLSYLSVLIQLVSNCGLSLNGSTDVKQPVVRAVVNVTDYREKFPCLATKWGRGVSVMGCPLPLKINGSI